MVDLLDSFWDKKIFFRYGLWILIFLYIICKFYVFSSDLFILINENIFEMGRGKRH